MCIDYIFTCLDCGYSWKLLGDGTFITDLTKFEVCCDKCGCVKMSVEDLTGVEKKTTVMDFTEQNRHLFLQREAKFHDLQEAFVRLSGLDRSSEEYLAVKNYIMQRML